MTNAILIIGAICFVVCIFIIIKNVVTYHHRVKIYNAIYNYNMDCTFKKEYDSLVNYAEVEDYNDTLWRLWDWTNKRIVPKETMGIIKPFIK